MKKTKQEKRISRHKRVRGKISGTKDVPRVAVFRSNKGLFVQFIDDITGKTLLSNSIKTDAKLKGDKKTKSGVIGEELAKRAQSTGITKIVFDRGGYKYHGRVKELAEGLRKGGLKF